MLAAITAFAVMIGSITAAPMPLTEQPDRDVRAGPRDLVVVIDQDGPDRATLGATFRLDTSAPGELRVDFWTGDGPGVESEFSVDGVTHVWLRQVDGEEPEVWLSPEIEAAPELMRNYWSVMSDLRLYEPEATARNPLCGAMRWGLRTLTVLIAAACCLSGAPAGLCLPCAVGAHEAHDAASSIDCNKNCRPDCPIP